MEIPTARRLPSGSWFVQLRIGGKSIPITASTKREAIAQAMAYKADIQRIRRSPEKRTLEQAYDDYIRDHPELSPSTIAGYKRLRNNTFQSLMPRQLGSITNAAINQEIRLMQASGCSPKYISNAVGLLRPVLKAYYKDFELDVTLPKKQRRRITMPSDADIQSIMAAAMIRLGIDSKYAMERNGWATDYMYKQVYGYIMEDKMSEESQKIGAYFLPKLK